MKVYFGIAEGFADKLSELSASRINSDQIELDVSEEKYRELKLNMAFVRYVDGDLVILSEERSKFERREALSEERRLILSWLSDNDWKPNKIVTKEWQETDERWVEYIAERQAKRQRLDEIDQLEQTL